MRFIKLLLVLILLFVGAGGVFAFWLAHDLRTPTPHGNATQYIQISRGSTPAETLAQLQSAGIIRREWALLLYIRLKGLGPRLKSGEYRFPSPISPLQVLRKLEEGEERLERFTVIEGWTRWDIAAAMARVPELKLRDQDEALRLMDDTSRVRDLDAGAPNLEGYLFPDTYSFPPDTTPKEVIATMVRRFRQVWDGKIAEEARANNKSAREIVTVASLVETEAKLADERPVVASVIYNRLRIGMPLGIDSTVIYASKLAGKWHGDGKVYQSDLDRVSPYNTRRVHGLPPGPIASAGARSIEAALRPAQSDYLYYVREPARNDGAHNFYNNEADFQRGVQALRAWERRRDAGTGSNADTVGGNNINANQ
jgi:UPF0755 protein